MKNLLLIILLAGCGAENEKQSNIQASDETVVITEVSKWTPNELYLETQGCSDECFAASNYSYPYGYCEYYCGCIMDIISKKYEYAELLGNAYDIIENEVEIGNVKMCVDRSKILHPLPTTTSLQED